MGDAGIVQPLLGVPTTPAMGAADSDSDDDVAVAPASSAPMSSPSRPRDVAAATASLLPRMAQDQEATMTTRRTRGSSTLLTVCPFILGNEFCERLAFYGLQTNLVLYLTREMGESPAAASIQVMVFEGTCYLTPLLGAWLADSSWGRYRTILFFSMIYFAGMATLAGFTLVPGLSPTEETRDAGATLAQNLALFVPLYTIALGTGGIKPNVSAFGADQFDESDPRDAKEKKSFFNWFYLFVNVGSLLAVTVVVWIQDAVSWSVGFAVPAAAMLAAIVVFVAGSRRYRHVTPTESPMARVIKVLVAARRNARRQRREARAAANVGAEAARRWRTPAVSAARGVGGVAPSPSSPLSSPLLQDASYRSAGGGGAGGGGSMRGGVAFAGYQGSAGGYDGPFNLPPRTPTATTTATAPVFIPGGSRGGRGGGGGGAGGGGSGSSYALSRPSSYQWLSFAEMGNEGGNENGNDADGGGRPGADGDDDDDAGDVGATAPAPSPSPLLLPTPPPRPRPRSSFEGFTKRQVEEVRMVVRMMPIFWTTAFYWAIYAQMGSFFVEQGQFMDRRIFFFSPPSSSGDVGRGGGTGPAPFEVPAASLALFNTVAIIALVPLYDRGLLPLLKSCGRRGPTLLQRIGWGLVVCALAMAAAAGVERARLAKVAAGEVVVDGRRRRGNDVAALSVFWQVPQYLLVGASEVLASIGQLEFFYDQAPDVMRSCSMALQLLSVAVGSYLSGAVVAAVGAGTAALGWGRGGGGWLPSELNEGRLDLFFWLMAALCVANTALFLVVASRYRYKDVPHGGARRKERTPSAAADDVVLVGRQQASTATTTPALPRFPRAPPAATLPRGIAGAASSRSSRGGGTSPADSAFGRSVTYVPPSPALPAPFR